MGDISTVLWYRGLLQSLWSTDTPRDWGHEVGGDAGAESQTERWEESERKADKARWINMYVDNFFFYQKLNPLH